MSNAGGTKGTIGQSLIAGVFAALGSLIGAVGAWSQLKATHEQQIIMEVMTFDREDNSKVVNVMRLLNKLDLLDDGRSKKLDDHFTGEPHAAPRFYFSAFVWSAFLDDVPEIKRAYNRLGIYSANEDEYNGDVTPQFIAATTLFQQCACELEFNDARIPNVALQKSDCIREKADGRFGIATMRLLAANPVAKLYAWQLVPDSKVDVDKNWCPGLLTAGASLRLGAEKQQRANSSAHCPHQAACEGAGSASSK